MEAVRKDEPVALGDLVKPHSSRPANKPATSRARGFRETNKTTSRAPTPIGGVSNGNKTPAVIKSGKGAKVHALLKAQLGEEIYGSWFKSLEFMTFEEGVVTFSVPVKFLRNWIKSHYEETLLDCCKAEFNGTTKVDVIMRQVGAEINASKPQPVDVNAAQAIRDGRHPSTRPASAGVMGTAPLRGLPRTEVGGFEGSPLDPRYTFANFVSGEPNQLAHGAAVQVAASATGHTPSHNPLFIHAGVGSGKTHLLHAIAWEAKRANPEAKVLYLTAEGFRFRFVEAIRGTDPLAFREKFREVDILLIDDLEFMHGEKTEQEFEHIVNTLLDGGRQLVVASARPPAMIEHLNDRMRSRLQRGLVAKIEQLDEPLRLKVLETRLAEKKEIDSSFNLSPEILELLAAKLVENSRELEGAITHLFANWQYMRAPITLDVAETVVRNILQGVEPRRIKIEDILRMVSRHFAISKSDLLSQRRHRSVVRPRQIGMYLAKQLTTRSLPEIGRKFGKRDHTTVLHAVRKITKELEENMRLREEIEDLKKMLSH